MDENMIRPDVIEKLMAQPITEFAASINKLGQITKAELLEVGRLRLDKKYEGTKFEIVYLMLFDLSQ